MAQIEVKVPVLSESVAEATLLAWHKKVGQQVSRDENMIDIETDKVVLETPAPAGAVVNHFGSWECVAQPTIRASGFLPAAPLADDSTSAAAPTDSPLPGAQRTKLWSM